jgi:tetratricopeptide (TPR) repeat protein
VANVFLSYDHEDLAPAAALAKALEQAGHTVWYDRHIHGGAQYSRKIEEALDAADAVLVLWSEHSLDSPWVRDEAAEGRDRGKLIPLSIGGVTPPMGFRQFQTLPLGSWKGRGKVPKLDQLIEAIDHQAASTPSNNLAPRPPAGHAAPEASRSLTRFLIPVALAAALLVAGWAGWRWIAGSGLPVVEVAAADASPRSQALANDLYVKLGSLAEIGEGKWQLVNSDSAPDKPTYVFRTSDVGSPQLPRSNLVLANGSDGSLLWSREFSAAAGGQADLRQQLSLTAGRVLSCVLESRAAGGLPRDLLKLFLNACAELAEASMDDPETAALPLRAIVEQRPKFGPAWGRLLYADTNVVALLGNRGGGERERAFQTLKADMEKARRFAPDVPELVLAELTLLPTTAYEQRLNLLAKAMAQAPDEPVVHSEQSGALQGVGRMGDAVAAARRSAELNPLSPTATTGLIMALAYAGHLEEARRELALAERRWAGTGALRDAQWSFHLRFGDPEIARKLANATWDGLNRYLAARKDPSPANIEALVAITRLRPAQLDSGFYGFGIQALAEFERTDELLNWIDSAPTHVVAGGSYMLFRPAFASFRRDPRFMAVARRIGLTEYWLNTNQWPDFCRAPDMPYDCKTEAARRG